MSTVKKWSMVLSVWIALQALVAGAASRPVTAHPALPPQLTFGAIAIPIDYVPAPVDLSRPSTTEAAAGVKAVAIVGDVGGSLATFKSDMDSAVATLQNHGVSVTKFYYGDRSFTWADIVAASQGAHFLMYMGHGVYSGDPIYPDWVGGFYLGAGQFVSPNQIRTDLAGRLAEDSVIIFSHACFTAGSTVGDPTDLSLSEVERRVRMYAEPFVDIGMEGYYANNYFDSAADYVDHLLEDSATRKNLGNIFKSVYPYSAGNLRDLSYPQAGYDLWLSGNAGSWDDAFVGIPGHVFAGDTQPVLSGIPGSVSFTYRATTAELQPAAYQITPTNSGDDTALHWTLTTEGTWFTIDRANGTTPDSFTITPQTFDTTQPGAHTGAVTVTVTDPTTTQNPIQRINLTLEVFAPKLGSLPNQVRFIYSMPEQALLFESYQIAPQNVGSDDGLAWVISKDGSWFTVSPTVGNAPQAATITPTDFATSTVSTYTGVVTVTITDPASTLNSPHPIIVTLSVVDTAFSRIFLPLALHN